MSRKFKTKQEANLGGALPEGVPELSTVRDPVLMIERLIKDLLEASVERLSDVSNEADLVRFFSHFFDSTAGTTERDVFVENFQRQPPKVVLGYPRSTAAFPCFSIITESEEENTRLLGDFVGETTPDEKVQSASEYVGAIYNSMYGIYIYAQHPEVCAYLYQFAKSFMHAAKAKLMAWGVQDVSISGGELGPDQAYVPENMFLRVVRASVTAPMSIPVFLTPDPRNVRITGIFRPDVVVDGMPSGVSEYAYEGNDAEEDEI